jgi:phosphatidylinositol glycan class M
MVSAALLFGLAVHWRLYPVIYAPAILRHLALTNQQQHRPQPQQRCNGLANAAAASLENTAARQQQHHPQQQQQHLRKQDWLEGGWQAWLGSASGTWLSPAGIGFALLSGGLFLSLAALFYRWYGWPFLQETYLYHATRVDPRHNFSPYFYPAYLASSDAPSAAAWEVGW